MYRKYLKRMADIVLAFLVLALFWWVYVIIAALVKIKLGTPVIYKTERIGKNERPFMLYKFRSMTEAKDDNGNLLSDSERLTKFGRILRATSLDELPEMWNILTGDMSLIGPRPLPGTYLPFYKNTEKQRHDVRPGLTGWAQVNGRNAIGWDEKFEYDVFYVKHLSFLLDCKIIGLTVKKVLIREGIGQGEERPTNLHEERAYMIKNEE